MPATLTALALATLTALALLLAGCAGSSPSAGVAHLAPSTSSSAPASGGGSSRSGDSASTQQQMVAFSQCMRSHGVPQFPEPTEGHLLIPVGKSGVNPRSAQFGAARKVCGKLLPSGGTPSPADQAKAQEGALQLSRCMRSHGVPDFPDPTFYGNAVQLKGVGGAGGIDLDSPQFKAAQKACQSVVPKLPGAKGGPAEGGAIGGFGPKGGGG